MLDDQQFYKKKGKDSLYRQVRMSKGSTFMFGWVENRLARNGRMVTVKGRDGEWKIDWVSNETVNGEQLDVLEDEFMHHRKRTDV